MQAYKCFDKRLKCRGFQYEVGKEYETDKADLCNCGFHACEYPLDCFNYYSPNESRYCLVELDGISEKRSDDSKICGTKIRIIRELTVAELTAAAVDYVMDKVEKEDKIANTGDWSSASNTGDQSSASVSGANSVAIVTGYQSKAKANIGSAICVVERGEWDGKGYPLLAIKAAIVDGEKVKADTWYKLENGEFVEVEDERD